MTSSFLAADAVAGSPAYAAGDYRLAVTGLYCVTSPLVARSGALSADAFAASLAGTTVSVGPGTCIVHGVTSSTEGTYQAFMTTTWTQVLTAASAQDRIDLVYSRVWNNGVDASGFTKFDLVYLTGTPSGSPVAPSIPAGQAGFKICTIYVPASGAAALTQIGVMPYTVASGGILPAFATSSTFSPETSQGRWRLDRAAIVQPGPLEMWDGSVWQPAVPNGYGRGLLAAPKTTFSDGTPAGTTETFDAVLGTYQCAVVSGRRYRAVMHALVGNGFSGDTYTVRIRDSGTGSAPTTTSPIVAQNTFVPQSTGTAGRAGIPLADTFLAGSTGTHTFQMSSQRISGSGGNFTPTSPLPSSTQVRELYVEDIGNV